MKKIFTSILAVILCAIITVTGTNVNTAYAADTSSIKVTFNKKSVTFTIDEETGIKRVKLSALKKKWGNPKVDKDEYMEQYTWKKGQTEIYYIDNHSAPERSKIVAITQDKNAAICGMKVGMKKAKAVKIMKKLGAENPANNSINAELASRLILIHCTFEKGKVATISCSAYAEDVSE